jgi:capsular exopolysaccharide synthesis family protein
MSIIEKALSKKDSDDSLSGVTRPISTAKNQYVFGRNKHVIRKRRGAITFDEITQKITIDFDRLQSVGLYSDEHSAKKFSDDVRRLKLFVLKKATDVTSEDQSNRYVLVTSSIPGEGKTHISLNLALSLAHEKNLKVVLIDTDVLKHDLTDALNLANKPGFVDILKSSEGVRDTLLSTIYATNFENLFIVPAGVYTENDENLVSSQFVKHVLDEIGLIGEDVLILMDSAPLLVSVQSQAVTSVAGQVLYVVEAGSTPQNDFKQALGLVDQENKAVGLVVNKLHKNNLQSYYGHYSKDT